jgi:hypothetical protein
MAAKNPTGEPDSAPFKVHLMTRAGRVMRAASPCERFPLRTKPSDLRVASLAGTTRCTISTKKFGPPRSEKLGAVRITAGGSERNTKPFSCYRSVSAGVQRRAVPERASLNSDLGCAVLAASRGH